MRTKHAQQRMQQRAIPEHYVDIALECGKASYTRGATCYLLTDRSLMGTAYSHLTEALRGLQVVIGRDGVMVTAMWVDRVRSKAKKKIEGLGE